MLRRVLPFWLVTLLPPIALMGIIVPLSGDRSVGHIIFHVIYIPILVTVIVLARRIILDPPRKVFSALGWVLIVSTLVMLVGHGVELFAAFTIFAEDGFQNLEHPEVFADPDGLHYQAANFTILGLLVSLATVIAMTVTAALHDRRRPRLETIG